MLLAALQSILNRNIAASRAAREACRRLSGKTLSIELTGAPDRALAKFLLSCEEERILIGSNKEATIAARVSGTPFAYLSLIGPQGDLALRSGGVHIEGDAEVAQNFRELFRSARPDLEEELARVFGDVIAHQMGNLARGAGHAAQRIAKTLALNVSEYLQEESRDVVPRLELEEYAGAIDKLRDDVERLEARLVTLERSARKPR
jgi:ubiquinone biosynthesis protein UbiJ